MNTIDRILNTLIAVALCALVAMSAAFALGCNGTVTIDGKEYTPILDEQHGRELWEAQRAPGMPSAALQLAMKQRDIVLDPEHGLLMGPEVEPHTLLPVLAQMGDRLDLSPGPRVKAKAFEFEFQPDGGNDANRDGIIGSDSRNHADPYNLPEGWYAQYAYEIKLPGAAQAVEGDTADGAVFACSGTMVAGRADIGDGSGTIGVTSAHCLFTDVLTGPPRRWWVMHRGYKFPNNGVSRDFQTPWVCKPRQHITAAWFYDADWYYDIAVMDWASQWCGDSWKHSNRITWANVDGLTHYGDHNPQVDLTVYNYGNPMPFTGQCGPAGVSTKDCRPSSYPGGFVPQGGLCWPNVCGMTGTVRHLAGSHQVESFNLDTVTGHSGGGIWSAHAHGNPQFGLRLIGVLSGHINNPSWWIGNDSTVGVARTGYIESWLQTSGVAP